MGKQLIRIIMCVLSLSIFLNYSILAKSEELCDLHFESDVISVDSIPNSFRDSLLISETEITGQNIRNFDVDSNGNVLICLCNNCINIYNESGEFLYSIRYKVNGTAIAFWDSNKVAIYLSKSDIVMVLDENGIIKAYKVKNNTHNSNLYYKIRSNKEITFNNRSYALSYSSTIQKALISNPTKCILKTNDVEYVIYENSKATLNAILKIFIIMFFIVIIIIGIKFSIKKKTKAIHNYRLNSNTNIIDLRYNRMKEG